MAKLPSLETEADGITPVAPKGAYMEDYRDDWVDLVARRLAKKLPDLKRPQRHVLASIAFERKYRRQQIECPKCQGEGMDGERFCPRCNGHGSITRATARYVGRDARSRPVVERLEYGQWRRWAVGREGQPVEIAEPVAEGKPW